MNHHEAVSQFRADRAMLESRGISWELGCEPKMYIPEEFRNNFHLAMDAQPGLSTDPNSAVPVMLTTMIDPAVYRILFSPNEAANIFGENRKGSWLDSTAMFPIVEHEGEVTSYGDYNTSGHVAANTNWPQRQAYRFQTVKEYGQLELEMAGLGRINYVSELDIATALAMDKFQNLSYFYGISGLQSFGWLNDPGLTAYLTPSPKAFGNSLWVTNNVVTASANEIFTDIQSLYISLVNQSNGVINKKTKMTLALSPESEMAMTATNSFNVNVSDLLQKNFPSLEVKTAIQYGSLSPSNPQGVAAGNVVQLVADTVQGQQVGYCAFSEKMRSFPIVRDLSSFKQKVMGGTWGAIVRAPFQITQMVGV